jgi:hypothetical protein
LRASALDVSPKSHEVPMGIVDIIASRRRT